MLDSDCSSARIESLQIAVELGADLATLAVLRDATRVNRQETIVLPMHRYEGLSRGKGWARKGKGSNAIWGEREENGYRVGAGRWIVGGNDGFSRKGKSSGRPSTSRSVRRSGRSLTELMCPARGDQPQGSPFRLGKSAQKEIKMKKVFITVCEVGQKFGCCAMIQEVGTKRMIAESTIVRPYGFDAAARMDGEALIARHGWSLVESLVEYAGGTS